MTSETKRVSAREEQFIRFIDTVKKTGKEPAIDQLDETLCKLVPPVRAGIAGPKYDPDHGPLGSFDFG